jgi:hypothetical protein
LLHLLKETWHPVKKSNTPDLRIPLTKTPKQFAMFAKIKSSNFIDALQFELIASYTDSALKGILKDDKGSICSVLERDVPNNQKQIYWPGLNDLPYGRYTLELSQGGEEMRLNLVKRI